MLENITSWWENQENQWKDLFVINYIYQYRYNKSVRENLVSVGTNPFEEYQLKLGKQFKRFEPDEEKINKIINLELFYASNCLLSEIYPLTDLKRLQVLDVSFNDLKNFPSSINIVQLKELYIEKNSIQSLDFLKPSQKLERLFSRSNELKDVDVLGDLETLVFIDISNNGLRNISGLKNTYHLLELQCAYNEIESLDFLKGHPKLEIIECSGNNLEDASFLFEIPSLRYADISDNPIDKDRYEWNQLTNKGIEIIID